MPRAEAAPTETLGSVQPERTLAVQSAGSICGVESPAQVRRASASEQLTPGVPNGVQAGKTPTE